MQNTTFHKKRDGLEHRGTGQTFRDRDTQLRRKRSFPFKGRTTRCSEYLDPWFICNSYPDISSFTIVNSDVI